MSVFAAGAGALDTAAQYVWDASWHAAVVVAVVLVVRQILGRRLPPAWRCGLWALVAVRLILFAATRMPWSVFALIERWEPSAAAPADGHSAEVAGSPASSSPEVSVGYGPAPVAFGKRVAPAGVERSRADGVGVRRVAGIAWAAGVVLLIARSVVGRRRFDRRVADGRVVHDPGVLDLLDECCRAMGVRGAVEVMETCAVAGPALAGVWRPRVLLPPGLRERLDRGQLRFVLLHEMAHLRRHDVLIEWLIAFVTAVHWFNPAVWVAAHCYRADRERSRDAMVVRAVGRRHRTGYGTTLLRLLELHGTGGADGVLAVAMLGERRQLERRIRMIAGLGGRPARLTLAVLAVICVLIAAVVLTNPRRVASTLPATAPTSDAPLESAESAALRSQLERRLPRVEFNGRRLDEVLDSLRELSGATIVVNWRALEAAGVDQDQPVSARMRDVSFSKALDVVLGDAGGGRVKLGYSTEGGVITVTTDDDLPRPLSSVVYDVRDLAIPVRDYDSDPARPLGRGAGTTRPIERVRTEAENVEAIAKLLRDTVDPASWNRPRNPPSILVLDGQLVVRQEPRNQRAIAQLLGQLRETRALEISTATHFVVLNPSTLPKGDPALAAVAATDPPQPEASGAANRPPILLAPDQAAALLKFVAGGKNPSAARAAPVLKTGNGQRAFVKVATLRAFVGDLKVLRDAGGKFKSYEPVVESAESGLTVDLQATVSADRSFVTVSLRPRLSKLLKLHTIPFDKVPADHPAGLAKPTIQQPEMLTTEAETTCSIPDGRTLVLSLGTDFGLLAADNYVPKAGDQIYMLVTPEITRTPAVRQ